MAQRINLMAAEFRADPYPFYARMRRDSPVCQVDPGGMWAVSRYDDVAFVLKSHEVFSSQGLRMALEAPWLDHNPMADSIVMMDPPGHTRLRNLVTQAFSPRSLARLEPRIRQIAGGLAEELRRRGEGDFIADFAMPLPAGVIGELLGLDPALHSRFKHWADDLVSINAAAQETPERMEQIRTTVSELKGYLREVIASRRANPRSDMVSDLLRFELEGRRLNEPELMGFLSLLLVAGLETTVTLLAHSIRVLAEHPGVAARLRTEPSVLPRFLEEVLRYEPPTQGTLRLTTAEVELGGVTLPPGTPVFALIGSASRDERRFERPDVFDLDRGGQSHLSFGHGIHFCLGASLARLEARLGLEELLGRCAGFSRTSAPVRWNRSFTVRSPLYMPIRVTPA